MKSRSSLLAPAHLDGPGKRGRKTVVVVVWFCSVLLAILDPRVGHTPWTYFRHLSLSYVILIDSSIWSPVHVLMLSIQAVRGLPRLHYFFLQAIPLFHHGMTIVAGVLRRIYPVKSLNGKASFDCIALHYELFISKALRYGSR